MGAFELQPRPLDPTLGVSDVAVVEGNSGTTPAVFTVTLTGTTVDIVTVAYATVDGSAKAGSDYVAASGTILFPPGTTSQPVSVTVNGDTAAEAAQTFFLDLSAPTNATIADAQGIGTIGNGTTAAACENIVNGTAAADTLAGTAGGDRISGKGANDVLRGFRSRDCLYGAAGDDRMYGGDARDLMFGSIGKDSLFGGTGPDLLDGGANDDYLGGSTGSDTIRGGAGNDKLFGGADRNVFDAGPGDDLIDARNAKRDSIQCGLGDDTVKVDAADVITAASRCETIIGP